MMNIYRHTPSMYPISPANAGFRSPYPTSLPITSSSLPRLVNASYDERDSERAIQSGARWERWDFSQFIDSVLLIFQWSLPVFTDEPHAAASRSQPARTRVGVTRVGVLGAEGGSLHSGSQSQVRCFQSLSVAGGIWTLDSKTGYRLSLFVCF